MFEMPITNRARVMDQLNSIDLYVLTRDMQTIDGRLFPAGTLFQFDHSIVDFATRTFRIIGHCGEQLEPVEFLTRNSEHRQIFEFTGGRAKFPPEKPAPPPLGEAPPPAASDEELGRWLLQHEDYKRTGEILGGQRSQGHWLSSRLDADELHGCAKALVKHYPEVARRLAALSVNFYYNWMSQATSGGEGTAMEHEVRDAVREMRDMARKDPG